MKTIIAIITVIILEACALTWLFSAENSQLKAENDRLKHQLNYQRDKNAELQWVITKMDLLLAGKTAEEIFQKSGADDATAEIEKDDEEENVIYLD